MLDEEKGVAFAARRHMFRHHSQQARTCAKKRDFCCNLRQRSLFLCGDCHEGGNHENYCTCYLYCGICAAVAAAEIPRTGGDDGCCHLYGYGDCSCNRGWQHCGLERVNDVGRYHGHSGLVYPPSSPANGMASMHWAPWRKVYSAHCWLVPF